MPTFFPRLIVSVTAVGMSVSVRISLVLVAQQPT